MTTRSCTSDGPLFDPVVVSKNEALFQVVSDFAPSLMIVSLGGPKIAWPTSSAVTEAALSARLLSTILDAMRFTSKLKTFHGLCTYDEKGCNGVYQVLHPMHFLKTDHYPANQGDVAPNESHNFLSCYQLTISGI